MTFHSLYYALRPLLPRSVIIQLRRMIVARKRARYADVWPIDENAARPPVGWKGWPDGKRFALVLTHDVESATGQDRCIQLMKLEREWGFRSSFNFVAEKYTNHIGLFDELRANGFEIGLHGLRHHENLFKSYDNFAAQVPRINRYLKNWRAAGFRTPCMYHNLDLTHELDIEYDASTFDTDPFEPQPDGVGTLFPFWVANNGGRGGYVELPYTLPQDFTLFILFQERNIDIWKRKLDWIVENKGMALLITHPDYMAFGGGKCELEEYPADYYGEFLDYVKSRYEGEYWNALPRDVSWHLKNWKANQGAITKEYKVADKPTMKGRNKIWIDLDNSPHVPLFKPIINELNRRGYECITTSRDCFQVAGLVDLHGLKCKTIGKHYGKNSLMKVFGLVYRGLQLMPSALKGKPLLALSHGSRSQHLAALLLGIPTIIMVDYEHVKMLPLAGSTWIITPEYIAAGSIKIDPLHMSTYPGLKEDVYVPEFRPNPAIVKELGLRGDHLIVTVRPPATEAHYHNPASESLFAEVIKHFGTMDKVTMVILPRNEKQADVIGRRWPEYISVGKAIIPDHVVDGLNLLWHSDLVISGGGTMNREAAALGVPVYSIFRGTIGAVDRYLAAQGRLVLLESPEDVRSKIIVERRDKSGKGRNRSK